MEQEIKEKMILWLYHCNSYEEFKEKKYYESDRRLIENTIQELTSKLSQDTTPIWNLCPIEISILKLFLNIGDRKRFLASSAIALKLNMDQSVVYNTLYKIKNDILKEINRRRITNMSKEEILDISVENFNLSNRAVSALIRNNIFTINELIKITTRNLRSLNGMGPKTAQEIIDTMHSFNIGFQGEKISKPEESIREQLETKMQKRYNIEQEINILLERKAEVDKEIEELLNKVEKINCKMYTKKLF